MKLRPIWNVHTFVVQRYFYVSIPAPLSWLFRTYDSFGERYSEAIQQMCKVAF